MPDFHGHPTGVLQNDHLRLEYLTRAGPRIVRLCLPGRDENLLGEFPSAGWDTPRGRFQLFGGHRLWAAPEMDGVSYVPDSTGLQVRESAPGVELVFDPGPGQGLVKTVCVELSPERPAVRLVHRLTNRFDHVVRVAAWGITIFPLGGRVLVPCPPSGPGFQPDRSLVLWPYSRWDDPRLRLEGAGFSIRAEAGMPALKVGTFVPGGTCAYLLDGIAILKRFEVPAGEYPDRGCNAEVYCSDGLVEVETLSPLADVPPGASLSATETWEIHTGEQANQILEETLVLGDPS